MDDEEGFLLAVAAAPDDALIHLVYADWLDERDDPGGLCLRYWVELARTPYSDTAYPALRGHLAGFRAALREADPQWVELVDRARPWVGERLAVLIARLYLREKQGRKHERQWVAHTTLSRGLWHVGYWPNDPVKKGYGRWSVLRHQQSVAIDPRTAEVVEPGG